MNYRSFVYVSLSKLGDQQSGLHSDIRVILYLTGLNYYGLLKPLFHVISMCMCSQCDSDSDDL